MLASVCANARSVTYRFGTALLGSRSSHVLPPFTVRRSRPSPVANAYVLHVASAAAKVRATMQPADVGALMQSPMSGLLADHMGPGIKAAEKNSVVCHSLLVPAVKTFSSAGHRSMRLAKLASFRSIP